MCATYEKRQRSNAESVIKRFIFIFIQPKVFYSGVTRHGKPINNALTTLPTTERASLNKKNKNKTR